MRHIIGAILVLMGLSNMRGCEGQRAGIGCQMIDQAVDCRVGVE